MWSQRSKKNYETFKSERNPVTVLLSMAETNGWNPEDITTLCRLPVDDYYRILKSHRGKVLRKIIKSCLQFDRIGNATLEMKEISMRAKQALERIGLESTINARRVRAYGVNVAEHDGS